VTDMKVERREREWDKSSCVHALISKGLRVEMSAGVSWRYPEANPLVEAERCVYCGYLRPLGESVESRESEIEARAAWLERDAAESAEDILADWSQEELLGHLECAHDLDTYLSGYRSATWAGWLARRIEEHDDEQKVQEVPQEVFPFDR
jgi:hypothetical protein